MTTEKSSIKRPAKKVASTENDALSKALKAAVTSEANAQIDPPAKPRKSKSAVAVPAEPVAKKKATKTATVVETKEAKPIPAKAKAAVAEPKEVKASKARPKPKAADTKPSDVTRKELKHLIAVAAYHRAEKRGFAPGYELQDWLDAEADIYEMIGVGQS
jgi:hypothetical protein